MPSASVNYVVTAPMAMVVRTPSFTSAIKEPESETAVIFAIFTGWLPFLELFQIQRVIHRIWVLIHEHKQLVSFP